MKYVLVLHTYKHTSVRMFVCVCACVLGPSLKICLLLKVALHFLKAEALGQIKCSQGIAT